MLDIIPNIDRLGHYWQGLNNKSVGECVKLLKKLRKHIENGLDSYMTPKIIGVSEDAIKGILGAIDQEIKYCNYYFEYNKKARAEDFDKWIYYKNADRSDIDDWRRESKGDCWIKHNGRIMAIININNKSAMTKITLELKNDSKHLTFIEGVNNEKFKSKHLKSEDSIKKYIEDLKNEVDNELLKEYLYPRYASEKQNFELLNQLLHIDLAEA